MLSIVISPLLFLILSIRVLYHFLLMSLGKGLSVLSWFSATISLLIFCLEGLSIFDSGVLKSPTIIVFLSVSFLKSSKFFYMYLGAPMLDAYMFTMFTSSWWIILLSMMKYPSVTLFLAFVLKSILAEMSSATPAFVFLSVSLENLFPALHFQSV